MTREDERDMACTNWICSQDNGTVIMAREVWKAAVKWADSHPQWISVEEELPKEGQVVLINTKGGSVSTACYTDGRFDITELFQAINVTHWMPIVPPRKEE